MNITEETIDSFLRGELNSTETEAFNKALASDSKLQQEVSFQKDIIDAVKQHRHQQLKDRLNAIDVKPVGVGLYASPYFKLAASIGVVALIVGSFSLFTNNGLNENTATVIESSPTGTQSIDESITVPLASSQTNSEAENTISKVEKPASASIITDNNAVASTDSKTSTKKPANNAAVPISKAAADNASYEDRAEEPMDSDNIGGINDNFNMPSMNHGGNTASSISSPQIKVSIVKENNLAYRFFSNQLFLHGNFSNSPYELFELNNKPSKQLFLYFENNYYELIQGKTKVTALTPITDKTILLQLTQLREH
jgi:hypothetical protein